MPHKKKKPGVMLYFDIRPALQRLSLEERGLLFEAILEFGEFKTEPCFTGTLDVAWAFIVQRLIEDDKTYYNKCAKASENANKRWHGEDAEICDGIQPDADACDGIQSDAEDANTDSTQRISTSDSTASSFSSSTAADDGGSGENRKTDEQRFEELRASKIQQFRDHIDGGLRTGEIQAP